MAFAILGIEKHKSMASVGSRLGHQLRTHEVPNADPAKVGDNLCSWSGSANELVNAMKNRVEPLKKRHDNVRAIELMLTASPEWFKEGGGSGQWQDLKKVAESFVKDTFGAENVMAFGVHLDEKTPHFWCMVTPIFEGKLRASHWLDGAKKMRDLQSKWAEKCTPLGLKRGVKGSNATHTEVKDFYAASKGDEKAAEKLLKEAEFRLRSKEFLLEKREKLLILEEKRQQENAKNLQRVSQELKKERLEIDKERVRNAQIYAALTDVQKVKAEQKFLESPAPTVDHRSAVEAIAERPAKFELLASALRSPVKKSGILRPSD